MKEFCTSLVRAGGLKSLIPAFMGLGLSHTRATHGASAASFEEEYCLSVLAALLWHLPMPHPRVAPFGEGAGIERLRLISKFSEDSGAKAQRLLELRSSYVGKVSRAEENFNEKEEGGEESEEEDEALLRRAEVLLKAGLFTLHRIDLVIARILTEDAFLKDLWGAEIVGKPTGPEAGILEKCEGASFALRSKFHEQGHSVVAILEGLSGYAGGLEGVDGGVERQSVDELIKKLKTVTGLEQ